MKCNSYSSDCSENVKPPNLSLSSILAAACLWQNLTSKVAAKRSATESLLWKCLVVFKIPIPHCSEHWPQLSNMCKYMPSFKHLRSPRRIEPLDSTDWTDLICFFHVESCILKVNSVLKDFLRFLTWLTHKKFLLTNKTCACDRVLYVNCWHVHILTPKTFPITLYKMLTLK